MNFLYYRTLPNVLNSRKQGFISALYLGRITRLTEHDDVIKPLLRGAPRLGLALGPAPARADPVDEARKCFGPRHLTSVCA